MKLNLSMRVLFEAQDLDEASPATVSRCGIIYLDQRLISQENMFKSLMVRKIGDLLNEEQHKIIMKFFKNSFADIQKESRKRFTEPVETVDHCLIHAIINILRMVLINDKGKKVLDELEGTKLF